MRQLFIQTLTALAKKDPRVVLLTGDLGFKILDDYRATCTKQFLNVGVAEASLIGMSTGMAMEGKIPFAYSIASFLIMRPFEHIRNDVAFHKANVKLVGVGGGFSYGPNGPSHHALNDVALMRVLPEMTVLTPGDAREALWAVQAAHAHQGPVYIRLGRGGEGIVHQAPLSLALGKSIMLKDGQDIAILVSGLMLAHAVEVAAALEAQGKSVRLVSIPCVKPLDMEMLADTFKTCRYVFTLEEHSRHGGFGSAIAEAAIEYRLPVDKLHIIAVPDKTIHETGSHAYLREQAGLTPAQMLKKIMQVTENYAHRT